MNINEDKFIWWKLLIIIILVTCFADWIYYRFIRKEVVEDKNIPSVEIIAVDNKLQEIQDKLNESKKLKTNLPGVIKNAKTQVKVELNTISDNDIANRWNSLLSKYREHRTQEERNNIIE